MSRNGGVAVLLGLLCAASAVRADHETEQVWPLGNSPPVDYPSGQAACAAYFATLPERPASRYGGAETLEQNVDFRSDVEVFCFEAYRSTSNGRYSDTESVVVYATDRIVQHEPEPSACEAQTGQRFLSITTDFPSINSCNAGCKSIFVDGETFGDPERWYAQHEFTGEQCTASEAPLPVPNRLSTGPGGTNTATDVAGVTTDYPAPSAPPSDPDPSTPANEATDVLTTEVGPDSGTTVETMTMQGGGEIQVVTDADGNVTFTDLSPINGTAQYAPLGTSTGTDTGGSGGGGTDGGTGGGLDGGSDGGSDGGADGGIDAGEGEEEGEEEDDREASGGTSCDAQPSCSGDPIDCAVVIGVWRNRCEAEVPSEPVLLAESGLDAFGTVESSGIETELDFGELTDDGRFDDTGLGLDRACPAGPSFDFFGKTLTFELTLICEGAGVLGILVLLVGALHSTRIVLGAF